jgi:flagellar hook-basal body complex protein FliE
MSAVAGSTLGLAPPHLPAGAEVPSPAPAPGAPSFEDVLTDTLNEANHGIRRASDAGRAFAAGAVDDIHGTMLALSQAEIELRYVGAVRNKILDAFYELWRMQI